MVASITFGLIALMDPIEIAPARTNLKLEVVASITDDTL